MADLALITSPGLALSWSQTQELIWTGLTNYMWTSGIIYKANFRIGIENAFFCPACGRCLPTHVATIDHIFAQSKYGTVLNSVFGNRIIVVVVTGMNMYTIVKGKVDLAGNSIDYSYNRKIFSIHGTQMLHQMDLCNLQILDWKCNSIKNNRDWLTAFPGRGTEPIVDTQRFEELWRASQ